MAVAARRAASTEEMRPPTTWAVALVAAAPGHTRQRRLAGVRGAWAAMGVLAGVKAEQAGRVVGLPPGDLPRKLSKVKSEKMKIVNAVKGNRGRTIKKSEP